MRGTGGKSRTELADRRQEPILIGNLQWRFTPSTQFAVTQQAYALKADYGNSVPDGRIRDEGSDLDVTWRGGAEWSPSPAHFVEFGAQAQSLEATRINRLFAPEHYGQCHAPRCR